MAKPWFLRFSIRFIILLMVAGAVGLGAWTHSARRQQAAVARIIAAGGNVYYEGDESGFFETSRSTFKEALASVVGRDFVFRVDYVVISRQDPDACIEALQRLSSVRGISARDAGINDEQFAALCEVPGLEVLSVFLNPITDEGLAMVGSARELRELNLAGTRITDRGVEIIAEVELLEGLNLSYTVVTDAGIRTLVVSNIWRT